MQGELQALDEREEADRLRKEAEEEPLSGAFLESSVPSGLGMGEAVQRLERSSRRRDKKKRVREKGSSTCVQNFSFFGRIAIFLFVA